MYWKYGTSKSNLNLNGLSFNKNTLYTNLRIKDIPNTHYDDELYVQSYVTIITNDGTIVADAFKTPIISSSINQSLNN